MKTRSLITWLPLPLLAAALLAPSAASAQKAIVYCPVGTDEVGCTNVIAALGGSFPAGVHKAYDGSNGTVDLRTADLWEYSVFVVPSLADGSGKTPYALLRDPAVSSRLRNVILGRVALWSGSPDLGTGSRTEKDRLLVNLAVWAGTNFGLVDGPGLVALQDLSSETSQRYGWLSPLVRFNVIADPALKSYAAVRTLTATGSQILQGPSGQLAYTNMASLGYQLPSGAAGVSLDAVGQTGTTEGGQVVLLTTSGGNTGSAILWTDKDDYAPGETVSIFGAGWQPGEAVSIVLHEDPLVHADRTLSAVAGPDGKFVNTQFSPEAHHVGVRFIVTATGASGVKAQTTFTDGNRVRFSTTSLGDVVATFGTIAINQCVNGFVQERQGENLDVGAHPSRSVVLSSVPAGAQFFAGGGCGGSTATSVTIPANQPSVAFSFRIASTGPYTLKATDSGLSDQNNASATVTVAANSPPVANNDTYAASEDTPLTVNAPGVLQNDTDVDGNPLTAVLLAAPIAAQGALTLNADGSFTFTPAANFNGPATFTYRAFDGTAHSSAATVTINVAAVNDAPVANPDSYNATEDVVLNVPAGTGVIANDTDVDGTTPTAVLVAQPPASEGVVSLNPNGSFTFTPAADFFGVTGFTYKATDGALESGTVAATITVAAVNDPPSFTKGPDVTVAEDAGPYTSAWATAISSGPANEAGQLLTFVVTNNTNPTLFSAVPAVSSTGVLTFTPAANAYGSATITLELTDNGGGTDESPTQSFLITVTPVNDAPTFDLIAGHTSNEDAGAQTVPSALTNASAGPNETQALTVTVTNDDNALFSSQPQIAGGTLTYTAAPNANGSATVTVKVKDDGGTSNGGVDETTKTLSITVNAVNDAPSFTKGPDHTSLEDAGPQSVAGWATGISAGPADESAQVLTFVVSADNAALFSGQPAVSAAGTLTYTAAPNAHGSANVTIKLTDNGGTAHGGIDESGTQSFVIDVTPVNDAPTFNLIAGHTSLEDAGPQTVASALTAPSPGPANESGQDLTLSVSNDNPALFSAQPTIDLGDGTLTYTAAVDANGSAVVTVKLQDDGGTANSGDDETTKTLTITITPVNDAPSFTKGADQTSLEDGGPKTVAGWATAISAGPPNESSQTVQFFASNDNNGLFSGQPAVAPNGTLTYQAAADANGSATVTLYVKDNGGTDGGGADTSANQTFTITITAVNDAPTYDLITGHTSAEDAGLQSQGAALTNASPGPSDESGQTLSITVTNDNNSLFTTQPAIDLVTGVLTYEAAADANGSATVTVVVKDNGGVANGGVEQTTKTLLVTVTPVNDAPVITQFSSPGVPNAVNTLVGASGAFTDVDLGAPSDSHTGTIDWGDGTAPTAVVITGSGTTRSVSGSHSYAAAGVYTLTLVVTDLASATDTEYFTYVVVYDPSAGFVTGGGFIQSPPGACRLTEVCEGATGKATFGFVSRYQKGANTPTGNTEFQFHAGNLNFKSASYEWLVVAGPRAQYKGVGTINGGGSYGFLLTAVDGQVAGGGNQDRFRIKIWDKNNGDVVVYDNELNTSDTATPTTAIAGGSIVIHSK